MYEGQTILMESLQHHEPRSEPQAVIEVPEGSSATWHMLLLVIANSGQSFTRMATEQAAAAYPSNNYPAEKSSVQKQDRYAHRHLARTTQVVLKPHPCPCKCLSEETDSISKMYHTIIDVDLSHTHLSGAELCSHSVSV